MAARYAVRVVLIAFACAFATTWFGWISLPVVGFVYSLIDRHARARGTVAASGAALGWLAILGAEAARGAAISTLATRVGEVMQLPPFAFVVLTLAFAAMLCGTAAVLGSAVARA